MSGKNKNRVFIIHGWEGHPKEGWFPWLKRELEDKGAEVYVPQMPNADAPQIAQWVSAISRKVGRPDKNTFFVGHSLGCQAIVRYLETLNSNIKVGGAVFVGGYFKKLSGIEDEGEDVVKLADKWLKAPIDFEKAKSHLMKSTAIFSDNDYYVPRENHKDFKKKLGSKIILQRNQGHFSGEDGIKKVPIILKSINGMMNELSEMVCEALQFEGKQYIKGLRGWSVVDFKNPDGAITRYEFHNASNKYMGSLGIGKDPEKWVLMYADQEAQSMEVADRDFKGDYIQAARYLWLKSQTAVKQEVNMNEADEEELGFGVSERVRFPDLKGYYAEKFDDPFGGHRWEIISPDGLAGALWSRGFSDYYGRNSDGKDLKVKMEGVFDGNDPKSFAVFVRNMHMIEDGKGSEKCYPEIGNYCINTIDGYSVISWGKSPLGWHLPDGSLFYFKPDGKDVEKADGFNGSAENAARYIFLHRQSPKSSFDLRNLVRRFIKESFIVD